MKRNIKIIAFIALTAIIGFALLGCPEPEPEDLTGTVSITGIAEVGQILAVDTSNLGGSGDIFYRWHRLLEVGFNPLGSASTYTVKSGDVGFSIEVWVYRSNNRGAIKSKIYIDKATLTGTASITGRAVVGEILSLDYNKLGGSGHISCQWMRNGSVIPDIFDNPFYRIGEADIGSTITVTVTRSDNVGSITSTPTLTIISSYAVRITGGGTNYGAEVGQMLTVNIDNDINAVSYMWMRNRTTVIGTDDTYTIQEDDRGSLITVTVTCSDYMHSFTDNIGKAVPSVITITEHPRTQFVTTDHNGNRFGWEFKDDDDDEGMLSDGILRVTANTIGSHLLYYQWYRSTSSWSNSGAAIVGATSNSYEIPTTPLIPGTYYYYCEIWDTGGAMRVRSNTAIVVVMTLDFSFSIISEPAETTFVTAGNISGNLSVEVYVTGTGPTLLYQWYINTVNSNIGGTAIGYGRVLTIPTYLTRGTTHYFYCVITTPTGKQPFHSRVATVNVIDLTVNTHPAQVTNVTAGNISGNLIFEVTSWGTTVSYQWYRSTSIYDTGTAIFGATNVSFTIPTTLDAGTYYYYCVVNTTHGAMSVRSNVARVVVQ